MKTDASNGFKEAVEFFLWRLRPLGINMRNIEEALKTINKLREYGFVPFSPLDVISVGLEEKAKNYYQMILEAELKGEPIVSKMWSHSRWQTFQIRPFSERLKVAKESQGSIQFVIWIDELEYQGWETLRELDKIVNIFNFD